jgi:hypothetical protein
MTEDVRMYLWLASMAVEIRELAEFQNFGGMQLHRMI